MLFAKDLIVSCTFVSNHFKADGRKEVTGGFIQSWKKILREKFPSSVLHFPLLRNILTHCLVP